MNWENRKTDGGNQINQVLLLAQGSEWGGQEVDMTLVDPYCCVTDPSVNYMMLEYSIH